MTSNLDPAPVVVFHDACPDGLVSAWLAWRALGSADFIAARYKDKPPRVQGCNVYILDFSYEPDELAQMADQAKHIVVLDHHDTAVRKYADWRPRENVKLTLDVSHSGAVLTLQHFDPEGLNWIADYAEDRDLWRWQLPHSKAVNALISSMTLGRTPEEAFPILNELRRWPMKQVIDQGRGALTQIQSYVRQMRRESMMVDFAGHRVPVVNAPKPMISELLHALAEDAEFAMGWAEYDGDAIFSLRSKSFEVNRLAERFGGGGHPKAAGFKVPFETAAEILRGEYQGHDPVYPREEEVEHDASAAAGGPLRKAYDR